MRKLFNKPIRQETTGEFFPEKISIEEFKETLTESFDAYIKNMKDIKADKEKHIEEWVEQYLAWLEIEQE